MTDDETRFAGLNAEERLDARRREEAAGRRPAKVISSVRDIAGDLRFRSPALILAAIAAALGTAGAVIQQQPLIAYAGAGVAGLLVLYGLSPVQRLGARFLPGVSRRRAVLFFSWWRAADGRLVTANAVESLLRQGCRRAGFEITELDGGAWTARRPQER